LDEKNAESRNSKRSVVFQKNGIQSTNLQMQSNEAGLNTPQDKMMIDGLNNRIHQFQPMSASKNMTKSFNMVSP
jgi:hypothetical protein